jgi:hypothetical protein
MDEYRERYETVQGHIRRLQAEINGYTARGEETPLRIRNELAVREIELKETRLYAHRALVRSAPPVQAVRLRDMLQEIERDRVSLGLETGADVKRARLDAGIRQKDLALLSGVGQSHISCLERGQYAPHKRTLQRIARGLRDAEKMAGQRQKA